MADDVINLTYGGSLFDVDLFAELLREEGLTVAYELPQLSEEERTEGPWEIATVVMSVTGPLWPAVWTAIRRFKASRLGQRAEISGPPELELSTEDRLALLDRLRDRGKISEEEHAQHRARILGDLQISHTTVASEKHRKARDWLLRSGYGLEMRVAAECRRQSLPTIQSVPYVDPTQANTVREADVVVRFGNQLSMSGDSWYLAAVIECKSPTTKPWAALMVPDKVTGFAALLGRTDSADEESWGRLINAWGGFVPFSEAASADALVSVHEDQKSDYNTAASALRQNVTFRWGENS